MIRAFVTGGSGFVGRNLIATLRARSDEVRALARKYHLSRSTDSDLDHSIVVDLPRV
jgi:uncharacterized protein YbjT (DUF2867 family)